MSTRPHGANDWRRDLAALPAAARAAALQARLLGAAATFVGAAAGSLDPAAAWLDLGFDSLRAVDFRSAIAAALGLELRSTLLFDHPTPAALTDWLLGQLAPAAPATPAAMPRAGTGSEPIAIVGAACRFPGGDGLEAFWRLLYDGGDAIVPIPSARFDIDALYDPDPAAEGKLYVRHAGLIDAIDRFDAQLFGISPREAVMLDPQQRLLLEVAWHALEHANLTPLSLQDHRVGVYVGTRASEYFDSQTWRTPRDANAHYPTGNAVSTAAGRLSYTFGFRGPCYALDTACSGSLVAVHVATRALRSGECDVALAGGVNAIFDPVPMVGLCRARMLAPDGRCKSFAKAANGYGRGEGAGMLVCKRLGDALAAGDRILAVVHGTAINQDGRSGGLTVPHGPAQAAVIRDALADAGLGVDAIDFVEAHGTGTALGDPIEIGALDSVFAARQQPLPVGSVKTNIGHLEAAAGVSGLLKAALALRERTLPRTLHAEVGSPHIDWSRSITRLVTTRTALPPEGPLHAGVSSFGFSGTNCHVVLGSAPAAAAADPTPSTPSGPWLLALQAAEPTALRDLARAHAERLQRGDVDLAAWCHALAVGRTTLPVRAAFVAADTASLLPALQAFADGDDLAAAATGTAPATSPQLAFLFPGQGAQRPGMGRELHAAEPVFRDALDAAASRLDAELPAPLRELMFGAATDRLERTDATQPVLCAYQLALLALLRSVGVRPAAVLGHSVGDFAAAVAANVLDGSEALQLCAVRGRLMVERCRPGGMLAVLAPPATWQPLLDQEPELAIAVHNGASNVVVGGELAALERFANQLQAHGITARRLPVSHAFHTALTEPMLAAFAARLAAVRWRAPQLAMIDTQHGGLGAASIATPGHWTCHVREPVQFAAGLATLAAGDTSLWLELGTAPLLGPLAAAQRTRGQQVLCVQRAAAPGRSSWLQALAELWVRGVAVDLVAANHGRGPARVTLPSYPFQRRHCWLPPRGEATVPATTPNPHPLLGARLQSSLLGSDQSCHAQTFTAARPAWLADHQALGHVLLPAAGMCELALAAARDRGAALPLVAHGVTLRQPLRLDAEPLATELLCQATPTGASFTLKSRDGDEWRLHCDGLLGGTAAEAKALDLTAIRARCPTVLTAAALYAQCTALQLQYGPTFRTVVALQRGDGELLATLRTDADAARACVLHPALLDGAFQTLVAALPPTATPYLPIGIEHLTVHRAGAGQAHCHVRVRPQDGAGQSRIADLTLVDDQGQRLATVRGLQLVPADPATLLQRGAGRELLYHHSFVPAPSATPGPLPARVLVVALLPTAAALAAALGAGLPKGHATVVGVEQLPGALANHRLDHLVLVAAGPDPAPAAGLAATATAWLHAGLATLRAALRTPQPPRPWLVTHGCQAAGPVPAGARPEAAVLLGVFRTLALEHPSLRPVAIDLDPVVPLDDHPTHVATVLTELRTTGDEPELALRGGQRRVLRLLPGAAPGDRLPLPATPFRVRAEAYGGVDQLAIVPIVRRAPGPGEVEVELRAAGLIFKDVLYARGMLASYASAAGVHDATAQPLGFEGTGVVVAVGPDVASPRLHDTVLLVGPDCLGTHTTLPASATCPLPPHIDPIAAAGMPIGFATVWYALVDRAAVQPGETVLVHAAAGGVGQAAIQLVASRGGRVLATASAGKRAFVRALGVEVVGDSRSADFAAAVLAATGGRGVDVVLNTLGGDTIAESLRALRRGGRFVELGKLGVWDQAKMAAVRADVAFTAFDLGDEFARDPALLPRLLGQVVAGLAEGSCRPPTPTVLPLPQVRQAFTHLGKGQHVGKVVVQIPATTDRGARSWLVTGASGGIAPAICHALVEAGARHLALLARSPVQGAWLDELRRRGVQLLPLQADVGDRTALAAALQQVRAALPPLGGIVHAAGALADGLLAGLDAERAAAAATAKLLGARWLDELTADDPITAFVLVSSMAATLGNPGQAAYAGANSYLDAFAAWRRTRGLAATSVAFGPWDGGGMASRLDERHRQRLQQHGVGFLPAALAARLLVAHAQSEPLAVLPVRWADWLRPFGDTPPRPWRELQPAATAAVARTGPLDLLGLPAAARPAALKAAVRRQVATVLGFQNPDQLDPERTFRDLGLDSLLAVDAKDQLERLLGLSLPATLLFDYPDLERLTAHLFACRFPASSRATPPAPAPAASETEGLAQLDTETLARLLAAELQPPRSHHE